MKTLSTLIATSVLLISATAANADYFEAISSEKIKTEVTDSRAAAYKAGADKLSSLKSATPYALSDEIGLVRGDIEQDTVSIDDGAYITVQEQMAPNGKLGYVGVVNAGISFEVNENDN